MKKPGWQRILELEEQAKHGSAPLTEPPPLPQQSLSTDPLARQMANDLHVVRQKAALDMNSQAIAALVVFGFIAFVVVKGFIL